MDMRRNVFLILLVAVVSSVLSALVVVKYYTSEDKFVTTSSDASATVVRNIKVNESGFPDFTYAAETSVEGVVYVKVLKRGERSREASILEYFFGLPSQPRESVNSGSGVIISPDGYIVTNNHVVSGASEVQVTLNNNKSYSAKVVGTDPVTDIALLKIEGKELPALPMGDSDSLRLGEWVLAIGSPFNLRSTITAGIVSAKGRSLPDMSGEYKIESFIQTDAAVNPGNSGGALVNTKGELVGINTAIASNTGSYTGYSFAVPIAIAKKVVNDIKKFGMVQRALLGISMQEMTDNLAEEIGYKGELKGVYVPEISKGGAADKGGMKPGDILLSIDGKKIKTPSQVQEIINGYSPNDNVTLKVLRNGSEKELSVTLQGKKSEISLAGNKQSVRIMGATVEDASKETLKKLDLRAGVVVTQVDEGKFKKAGIKEGFVITYVNQEPVATTGELVEKISSSRRSVLIEGVDTGGDTLYYAIGI